MNAQVGEVAENIRREREKRNLSISRLAERANLSASCISKMEMADTVGSLKTLLKIAAALEIPVGELLNTKKDTEKGDGRLGRNVELFQQVFYGIPEEEADDFFLLFQDLLQLFQRERGAGKKDIKQEGR